MSTAKERYQNERAAEMEANLEETRRIAGSAQPASLEPLHKLLDYADDSDGSQYGTLSTSLVRDLVNEAIAGITAQVHPVGAVFPAPDAPVSGLESVPRDDAQEDFVLRITTAYESGFGHALCTHLANPYTIDSLEWIAWNLGREEGTAAPEASVPARPLVVTPEGDQGPVSGLESAMSEVADKFAHKLALDLECILSDSYSGRWYDSALQTLGEYRMAMNAIHERESPTYMGEPLIAATPKAQTLHEFYANGGSFASLAAPKAQPSQEVEELYREVGRQMVAMTTTVRGPDEWLAIPELWRRCMEERDRAYAALASQAQAPQVQPVLVSAASRAVERIRKIVNQQREPAWAYRNTITHNRNEIRAACDDLEVAIAAQPAAPQAPSPLGAPASPSGSTLQPPSAASAAIPGAEGER